MITQDCNLKPPSKGSTMEDPYAGIDPYYYRNANKVINLIEWCLQNCYITKEQLADKLLENEVDIDTSLIISAWNMMETMNLEYFKVYNLMVTLIDQIRTCNRLLELQYQAMKLFPEAYKFPSASTQNKVHSKQWENIVMANPVLQQPVVRNTGQIYLERGSSSHGANGVPAASHLHPNQMEYSNNTISSSTSDMAMRAAQVELSECLLSNPSETSHSSVDTSNATGLMQPRTEEEPDSLNQQLREISYEFCLGDLDSLINYFD